MVVPIHLEIFKLDLDVIADRSDARAATGRLDDGALGMCDLDFSRCGFGLDSPQLPVAFDIRRSSSDGCIGSVGDLEHHVSGAVRRSTTPRRRARDRHLRNGRR